MRICRHYLMADIEYKKCGNEFTFRGRQFNGYTTLERLEETCKFEFLPSDIVISTFPRSGTTFTQEIIWQIKNRKTVQKGEQIIETTLRIPFLEFNHEYHLSQFPNSFYDVLNSQREQPYRLIKTHVPYDFIRENFEKANPKLIVVMRNAKDCLVSNYHHYSHPIHEWNGTFDDFFTIFLHGKTYTGNYFDNNVDWWALRDRGNVLVVFYEDLVSDLRRGVRQIADFLGEELTECETDKVAHNCSFETMSANERINERYSDSRLIRAGRVGNWREYLSEQQNERIDHEIAATFRGTGLEFCYQ